MASCSTIPDSFLCPITHNIMSNPYIDNDGNTYEYLAITKWLLNNNTSPITRQNLKLSDLKPNRSLLELINLFKSKNYIKDTEIIETNNNFKLNENICKFKIDKYIKNKYTYFQLNIDIFNLEISPPVDIVVVIDISGSMDSNANVQQNGKSVDIGFTILDITKHALNTIIESIKPNDRISIITFSDYADILIKLTHIDNTNKEYIKSLINNLKTKGATNIWAGLNKGLEQYLEKNNTNTNTNRVKSLLLLTDGIPSNHLLPPRGILETLDRKLKVINDSNIVSPNIYTFGFGNNLDTDILVNIAIKGNGHFSYIPDSGFVGTVFIHSLAHIKTLICNTAIIDLDFICNNFKNNVEVLGFNKNNINLNTLHIGSNKNIIFKILSKDLNNCLEFCLHQNLMTQ